MVDSYSDPCPSRAISVAIVEDDPVFAAHLKQSVEESGRFKVVAMAGSAEEALAWSSEVDPAVLLLDVTLPGLLGSAAVQPVMAQRPNLLIIMLTANSEPEILLQAMSSGAVGYLIKGIPGVEPAAAIDEVMAGGVPMSPGIARRLLKSMPPNLVPDVAGTTSPVDELTSREREILQFVAEGLADKEIADRLFIAQSTVKNHLANIYGKWNVRSRTEAAVRFVRAAK